VAYQTWRISRGELAPTDAQEIAAIAGTRRVDPSVRDRLSYFTIPPLAELSSLSGHELSPSRDPG